MASLLPKDFIYKRLHSITGLFLVLYLMEHLLVNSQAALFIGNDGQGFINSVNSIHDLPYLKVLEISLIAIPLLIHMWWGVIYAYTGKFNSYSTDGTTPSLAEYPRNHAYTWQRITSWILVFAILAHVVHMRFLRYPSSAKVGHETEYMIPIQNDPGLATLSERINVQIWDPAQILQKKETFSKLQEPTDPLDLQTYEQEKNWIATLTASPLKKAEVMAVSKDFGTAELMMVRDAFKSPLLMILYTFFVLAACFHAFNGLWTFMISWGVTLSESSQRWMRTFSTFLMVLVTFLGLSAIWLTYWINLKN